MCIEKGSIENVPDSIIPSREIRHLEVVIGD